MVTAENKVNRFGSRYSYYHCTKKRMGYRCEQPCIQETALEKQIVEFLESLTPPENLHQWAMARLDEQFAETAKLREAQRQSLEKTLQGVHQQLENLTKLRLRDLVTDDEYICKRQELERERIRLQQNQAGAGKADPSLEPDRLIISFNNRAVSWFKAGTPQTKRFILEIVGSNPTLKDKILSIEAAKPFRRWGKTAEISQMRRFVEDVHTLVAAHDPKTLDMVSRLETFMSQMENRKITCS
jgi:hypothetical protein